MAPQTPDGHFCLYAGALTPRHLGGHFGITHLDEGALSYLDQEFVIRAMLDIGCGPGGMVDLARGRGIRARGIDGDPGLPDHAHILKHDFVHGRAKGFEKWLRQESGPRLAWCVEFLEHVYDEYLLNVWPLLKHADVALVTTAPPGMRGYHHVNCREEAWWVDRFADWGLQFSQIHTDTVREASTMEREFVRERGMVFIRER